MSERTKGRLINGSLDESIICDADGYTVAEVLSEKQTVDEDIATAKHLVACWNACEDLGLTTEQLEAGALRELVGSVREMIPPGVGAMGHNHKVAGFWDDPYGNSSGKPCDWCAAWNKVRDVLAKIGK
jgi:hypothetical protein